MVETDWSVPWVPPVPLECGCADGVLVGVPRDGRGRAQGVGGHTVTGEGQGSQGLAQLCGTEATRREDRVALPEGLWPGRMSSVSQGARSWGQLGACGRPRSRGLRSLRQWGSW